METRSSHDIRYIITKSFKTDHEKAMNTYITNVSSLKNFSQNERKKKKRKERNSAYSILQRRAIYHLGSVSKI